MAPGVPYDNSYNSYYREEISDLPTQSMAAVPAALPAQPQPQPQPSGNAVFLHQWQQRIQPRLTQLLAHLGSQEVAKSLALAQIITYLPVLTEGKQLLKAEALCLLGNPILQDFHVACCHQGLPLTQLGPMGKVWESGVVQIVQHSGNLSTDTHPLNLMLPSVAESAVDEILYLPVYDDAPGTPVQGVVAVLELMVNPRSTDVMVVANLISTVSDIMGNLGLAISNPAQQAHQHSGGKGIARKSAPAEVGMRSGSSYEANNQAWATTASASDRSMGSGGGLARTASMRVLGNFEGK